MTFYHEYHFPHALIHILCAMKWGGKHWVTIASQIFLIASLTLSYSLRAGSLDPSNAHDKGAGGGVHESSGRVENVCFMITIYELRDFTSSLTMMVHASTAYIHSQCL